MAKKKEISKSVMELKKDLPKAIVGTKVVLKNLKAEGLVKVYLASNCPAGVVSDIKHYAGMVKVPIVVLKMNNEELGVFCKKHFFISVLGIKK